MAEQLSRSKIIQQQIENLQRTAPPELTQAERDQIMKGRKGQKDIDAGRAAIAERELAIREHADQVNALTSKLDEALAAEGTEQTRQEREAASDPLWNTYIPSGVGAVGGAGIGEIVNRLLKEFNSGNAEAIKGIARELGPVEKLTTSQLSRARAAGAASAAEKYAPSSPLRQGAAVAGRGLSYGIPAGIFYNEYSKYEDRAKDKSLPESERMGNQRVANALLGVSTGIAADGGMRFFFPSRHEGEGEAMARINAARDYSRRMDAADEARAAGPRVTRATPAPDAPSTPSRPALPGSKTDLLQQAKRLGITGRSKMNTDQLREAVSDAVKNTSAPRGGAASKALKALGPVTAGLVAADAAYNQARARGADVGEAVGEAAPQAVVAGGGTAAAGYGMNRLLNALPSAAGTALSAGAPLLGPMAAGDITEQSQERLNMDRNIAARYLPSFMRAGRVEEAYQMAQVPERNMGKADEFATSRGLEIPEGIPAPRQDGSSPYDAAPQAPEDFDTQLADLERLFAEMGGGEQDPMQNAQASRRVAVQAPPQWQPQMDQNRLLAVR